MASSSTTTAANPRLAVQAFWLMLARTVGFVFTLAMPLVMVRVFDQVQFGAYKQAFILVGTAVILLPFSVGVSAFYYLPRIPEQRRELIFNIVAYHAAVGALMMAVLTFWPELLTRLFDSEILTPLAPIIGAVMATWVFSAFLELVATANQEVAYSTGFIVLAQLTKAILLISAALSFRTVEAVLWAALIQGLLQSAVMLWYLHSRFPHFWRFRSRALALEQAHYVLPIGATGLLVGVQSEMHHYLVAHSFTTAEYAIYAVGTAQIPLMGILSQSINAVMQARMSKLQQNNETESMLALVLRSWRTLSLAFIPAFAGLLLLRQEFITVLYTADYAASVPIFAFNLLLIIHGIFITDAAVRSFAEYRFWFLRLRIVSFVLQVVLSFLLLRYVGMSGALLAMIVAMCFERILNVRLICRVLHFRRHHLRMLGRIGAVAFASIAAAALTWTALSFMGIEDSRVRLAAGIAIFGCAYIIALLAARILDHDERELVRNYTAPLVRFLRVRPDNA